MMKLQKQPSRVSYKKGVFKNFTEIAGKRQCLTLFLVTSKPQVCNFIEKATPTQEFHC